MNKEEAQKEYEKVRQWVLEEEDKVTEKLKEAGKDMNGLDVEHEEYAYIYRERDLQIAEIRKIHLGGEPDGER